MTRPFPPAGLWCRLAGLALLALPAAVQATSVQASYTPLGGGSWQVALSFANAAGDTTAPGLSVLFDAGVFSNLRNAVAPAAWDALLLQPDLALPAAGVFDVYALTAANALQPGQTQAGFSLQFNYSGNGTPGALPYQFYRLDSSGNAQLLASGNSGVSVVPEPASAWLTAAGVLVLLRVRRGLHNKVNA